MSKKLETEILINLTGNLTAKARQYGASMSEFARRNERAMSVVKATSAAAGRGLDMLGNRYTGMIAGFAGGSMLRNYTQLDRRLTRMGITAGKTREEISTIFDKAQDAAIKFKVDTSEIQGAFEMVNARSGDLDLAIINTDNIAQAIAASGAAGADIGGLISEFKKLQIEDGKKALLSLDGMNKLGKEGAFELKDAAEKLPTSLSMYAAAGGRGVKGVMDVMVVAESAMDVMANKDKASTAVENFITDIQNPKVLKALKANGIDVFGKDGRMRALPDILKETAVRSAKNGAEKQSGYLTGAGFNQDSTRLILGVSGEAGAQKLKTYMGVVADGSSIIDDAKYAAQDFTSALQSMTTTWEKFANSNLAKPVQELADALNSVDQDTVQDWMEIGKNVAIATGGLLAARKTFQIGKGAYDFLRPKNKGIPKDVTESFGSGVTPVYVVNMGTNGMGGAVAGGQGIPGAVDGAASKTGYWALAGRAIGGAFTVYLQTEGAKWAAQSIYNNTGLSDWAKDSDIHKWTKDNFDPSIMPEKPKFSSVWKEVTDWLTSAPPLPPSSPQWDALHPNLMSTYPRFSGPGFDSPMKVEVEVGVSDDRVHVKSIKRPWFPDVKPMSPQTGIHNVEQD
ncbi:phage tail tape measure protein [Pectobacterium aroidearum]|uniref:phage tail tape measure protein n=1 Tax=Pectobacterium aroidearum TaxID=1201031 RepID=UPI0032EF52BD